MVVAVGYLVEAIVKGTLALTVTIMFGVQTVWHWPSDDDATADTEPTPPAAPPPGIHVIGAGAGGGDAYRAAAAAAGGGADQNEVKRISIGPAPDDIDFGGVERRANQRAVIEDAAGSLDDDTDGALNTGTGTGGTFGTDEELNIVRHKRGRKRRRRRDGDPDASDGDGGGTDRSIGTGEAGELSPQQYALQVRLLFHRIGLFMSFLFLIVAPDSNGAFGLYPLWVCRLISNLISGFEVLLLGYWLQFAVSGLHRALSRSTRRVSVNSIAAVDAAAPGVVLPIGGWRANFRALLSSTATVPCFDRVYVPFCLANAVWNVIGIICAFAFDRWVFAISTHLSNIVTLAAMVGHTFFTYARLRGLAATVEADYQTNRANAERAAAAAAANNPNHQLSPAQHSQYLRSSPPHMHAAPIPTPAHAHAHANATQQSTNAAPFGAPASMVALSAAGVPTAVGASGVDVKVNSTLTADLSHRPFAAPGVGGSEGPDFKLPSSTSRSDLFADNSKNAGRFRFPPEASVSKSKSHGSSGKAHIAATAAANLNANTSPRLPAAGIALTAPNPNPGTLAVTTGSELQPAGVAVLAKTQSPTTGLTLTTPPTLATTTPLTVDAVGAGGAGAGGSGGRAVTVPPLATAAAAAAQTARRDRATSAHTRAIRGLTQLQRRLRWLGIYVAGLMVLVALYSMFIGLQLPKAFGDPAPVAEPDNYAWINSVATLPAWIGIGMTLWFGWTPKPMTKEQRAAIRATAAANRAAAPAPSPGAGLVIGIPIAPPQNEHGIQMLTLSGGASGGIQLQIPKSGASSGGAVPAGAGAAQLPQSSPPGFGSGTGVLATFNHIPLFDTSRPIGAAVPAPAAAVGAAAGAADGGGRGVRSDSGGGGSTGAVGGGDSESYSADSRSRSSRNRSRSPAPRANQPPDPYHYQRAAAAAAAGTRLSPNHLTGYYSKSNPAHDFPFLYPPGSSVAAAAASASAAAGTGVSAVGTFDTNQMGAGGLPFEAPYDQPPVSIPNDEPTDPNALRAQIRFVSGSGNSPIGGAKSGSSTAVSTGVWLSATANAASAAAAKADARQSRALHRHRQQHRPHRSQRSKMSGSVVTAPVIGSTGITAGVSSGSRHHHNRHRHHPHGSSRQSSRSRSRSRSRSNSPAGATPPPSTPLTGAATAASPAASAVAAGGSPTTGMLTSGGSGASTRLMLPPTAAAPRLPRVPLVVSRRALTLPFSISEADAEPQSPAGATSGGSGGASVASTPPPTAFLTLRGDSETDRERQQKSKRADSIGSLTVPTATGIGASSAAFDHKSPSPPAPVPANVTVSAIVTPPAIRPLRSTPVALVLVEPEVVFTDNNSAESMPISSTGGGGGGGSGDPPLSLQPPAAPQPTLAAPQLPPLIPAISGGTISSVSAAISGSTNSADSGRSDTKVETGS